MTNDILGQQSQDQEIARAIDELKTRYTQTDGSIDVDGLLKSKAYADLQVRKVEGETANLRKELDQRITYQDLLDKMSGMNAASRDEDDNLSSNENQNPVVTEEAIAKMVDSRLNAQRQALQGEANVEFARQELTKVWGTDYVTKLRTRAAELNLTEDYVKDLAVNNPKALVSIMVTKTQQTNDNSFTPPASSVRTTQRQDSTRNWKYYEQMAKTDPKRYNTTAVQNEIHSQALALGEAFYS